MINMVEDVDVWPALQVSGDDEYLWWVMEWRRGVGCPGLGWGHFFSSWVSRETAQQLCSTPSLTAQMGSGGRHSICSPQTHTSPVPSSSSFSLT